MSTKWNDVQIMLLQFEEQMDEQSIEIANLEIKNAKLEIELKNQVNLLNESKTREFENEEVNFNNKKNVNLALFYLLNKKFEFFCFFVFKVLNLIFFYLLTKLPTKLVIYYFQI